MADYPNAFRFPCIATDKKRQAEGVGYTAEDYPDLIFEFTKDERLHLQRLMVEQNV